jgi:hypothetical protein
MSPFPLPPNYKLDDRILYRPRCESRQRCRQAITLCNKAWRLKYTFLHGFDH